LTGEDSGVSRDKNCHLPRIKTPFYHETQAIPTSSPDLFLSTFFAYTVNRLSTRCLAAEERIPMAETVVLLIILVALWSIPGSKARRQG